MELIVCSDGDEVGARAARLLRERAQATPDLVLAAPAGRSPRPMYRRLAALQPEAPVDFRRLVVFAIDELAAPAPVDGCLWRQVRREFLDWAAVPPARQRPFSMEAPDLATMCRKYEAAIEGAGGLDLIVLGLGPNGHVAGNEPGSPFESRTRAVTMRPESVAYLATDECLDGPAADAVVTLGLATILEAREVVLIATGAAKRAPLRALLEGDVSLELPASVLKSHSRCTVIADRAAVS